MNLFIVAIVIGMIVCVSSVAYVIFYDASIDVRLWAENDSCDELKWKIERQYKKIYENAFTYVLEDVYTEKGCESIDKKEIESRR